MKPWKANIGLWDTGQRSERTWIVDQAGQPVCMCDETAERSVSRLAQLGFTVVPRQGETIQSLIQSRYLDL